jgi:hypothetical protein
MMMTSKDLTWIRERENSRKRGWVQAAPLPMLLITISI